MLYLFQDDRGNEYTVLVEDTSIPINDFCEPGYTHVATLDVSGDLTVWPTERSLRRAD